MFGFAPDVGSVDVGLFAQYGVLGILCLILIFFAKGAYQRERDRADRADEENKRLNQVLLEKVIPALLSATRAAEESAELLREIQRERERDIGQLTPRRTRGGS